MNTEFPSSVYHAFHFEQRSLHIISVPYRYSTIIYLTNYLVKLLLILQDPRLASLPPSRLP